MTYPQSDLTGLAADEVGMKLLAAAEIIRRDGWCQGLMHIDGRVCAIGAIIAAYDGEMSAALDGEIRMGDYLYEHRSQDNLANAKVRYVARWNDASDRTAEQVIDALTAAALSHAAQG